MNALGSPLGAMSIDYLSHTLSTAMDNIWAWVAVITAVLGLWRIRSFSLPPRRVSASTPSTMEPAPVPTPSGHVPAPLTTESEGSPKGKFSVYYYNDDLRRVGDDDGVEREELIRWRRVDDWERKVAVRMGDMGWYRCLDFKVLDGSVVRLWE